MRSLLFQRLIFVIGLVVAGSIAAIAMAVNDDAKKLEFFETRVRPLLVEHCLECHASDTEASGGLRLDSKEGWQTGGDSGAAIVPGAIDASLVIRAIEYNDPHLRMPPDGKLSETAIADLRRWIADGAVDPREALSIQTKQKGLAVEDAMQHWAYRPIQRPSIPALDFEVDSVNPVSRSASMVDAFIESDLVKQGLAPNSTASRRVLLRRLMIDLHGLPPTPEEIHAFESDQSVDAYERLVDRLLASPRFAERMARHWLDVARFAESLTLRGFVLEQAWRYRDYCIEAFDRDMPFNRFIQEQIAGDLMAAIATPFDGSDRAIHDLQNKMVAVTFLLLGNTNLEEQDKKQLEMDVVDEQLDTLGKAFLGQTLGCARCHDHKFDPIPTRDYYALAGILKGSKVLDHANVSKWIEQPLPLQDYEQKSFKRHAILLGNLKQELARLEKATTTVIGVESLDGIVVDDANALKIGNWVSSTSVPEYVGAGYLHDDNQGRGEKTVTFEAAQIPPGKYEVRIAYSHGTNRSTKTSIRIHSADGESVYIVDQRQQGPIGGVWQSLGTHRFEKDGQAFVVVSNEGADGHVIADAVQWIPVDEASVTQPVAVQTRLDNSTASKIASFKSQIQAAQEALNERPKCMAMVPIEEPKDLAIHIRGSVHRLGEVAPRGFLQCLATPKSIYYDPANAPPDRLSLARWMTDRDNPLTSRVIVNRVWYWIMGEGIVASVDNFGTTGDLPSHPELLDALATKFVDDGWSIKSLVREIVLSKAYQRSSMDVTESAQRDPTNRYYWRAHRKRLDAEAIRDSVLQISGRLDLKGRGKTFPNNLESDYSFTNKSLHRSIYLPAFRNSVDELLRVFDVADSSVVVGKRNQTTVVQQALYMSNDPWMLERSNDLASILLRDFGTNDAIHLEQMVEHASFVIWGRGPTPDESKIMTQFLQAFVDDRSALQSRLGVLVQSMFASLDFRYVE